MGEFRVTLQTVLADREHLPEFEALLAKMEKLGLYGLELNLPDLEETLSPVELKEMLQRHGLVLTYVASGVYAGKHGLALCAEDEDVRKASVEGLLANIRYAKAMGSGVIIGTLKGAPKFFHDKAKEQLIQSLKEAMAVADPEVPVLLEATNHYEANTANMVAEAREIVDAVGAPNLLILPDTYHMNIEEKDAFDALEKNKSKIRNIHISDNNRYYPGFGAIDFKKYLEFFRLMSYDGTLGIEGRNQKSVMEDLEVSMEYLAPILARKN